MNQKSEIEIVELMIKKYCHKNHGAPKGSLCSECSQLLEYAKLRRSKCPHGDNKPFCSNCRIHCYKPDMREKIRAVMRYSGPRMMSDHPIVAVRHLVETKKEKRKLDND